MFKHFFTAGILVLTYLPSSAQDPKLPAANLGLTNMQDGKPPGTGFYFLETTQLYSANKTYNGQGKELSSGVRTSILLAIPQLIYISKLKFAGGNVGGTVLFPFVKISANDQSGLPATTNPGLNGDIIAGPFIQWFNATLAGMPIDHRLEIDVSLPVGAWQGRYAINPGAHAYSISPHYTFTISPAKHFSVSMRQYLNYNFNQIGTDEKAGGFYNANYSFEYELFNRFRAEVAGYYLRQLLQDSKGGNTNYFQDDYGILDTRERVFAVGPGLGYVTPTGLFIEVKNMWETNAVNRTQGYRATLVLAYRLKE